MPKNSVSQKFAESWAAVIGNTSLAAGEDMAKADRKNDGVTGNQGGMERIPQDPVIIMSHL
jgi:hypothetical protein